MSLAAAKTEPWRQGRIPVLDIGAYLAGEAGAAAPLACAIARTCEDTGFLVVANHGVPQHLVDDTFAVAQQFFARPEAEKLALKVGKYNIGYLPFGGQVVRHSPVNRNTKPNFSESFYITRDRAPDHPDIVNDKPLVGLTRWPPDVPGTFVVNTGAMLARYSNDRFRATPHRVINRNDASRYAIPFFLGPNHDCVISCVPSCVGPDKPPHYEPTTYGAFTQRLLTLNFAHRSAG